MSMLSGPRVANPAIMEEDEWRMILRQIGGGMVIPVIGEHLTVMTRGDPPGDLTLASYLAEQLDLPGPPTASLDEIASRYLKRSPQGFDDLCAEIFGVLPTAEPFPLPTPLKQLAEIRDFNLFVTTSFDPYMALALNEVRFGRRSSRSTRVLSYERNSEVDIPEKFAELDHPVVYHLFGKAQVAPMFAVTDEDVLEFVHTLQARECQPRNLAEALRKQRLLVIGTRLTGWLTRFFLRVSSSDRLRDARRVRYVVDETADADADQSLFTEHFGTLKLLPMSPVSFVDELVRRWKAGHPELVATERARCNTPVPVGGGDVFLSYASEDLAVVKGLRERLEREAGVRVWLDKESLRGGDPWERHIADALRRCAVCVPVISASAKSRPGFRYVRSEWKEALRLQGGMPADQRFLIPLVIDDTPGDDLSVDPDLRRLHWRQMRDEEDMRRFIADVRASVERSVAT